jgi:hypothetical protein
LFNLEPDEEFKKMIVENAQKKWYETGKWRYTRAWINVAVDTWNEHNPDKKVMYVRTEINSKQYDIAMKKWLPIVFTYKTSYKYTRDYTADGVVNGTEFDEFVWWHALRWTKPKNKKNELTHCNTYPKSPHNIYDVKHLTTLEERNVYYWTCYIILPDPDNKEDEIKKYKLIQQNMKNNSKLRNIVKSQKTKDVLNEYNEYFRTVWLTEESLQKKIDNEE